MLRFRPKTYKDLGEKYSSDERALGYIGYDDEEKECGFIVFYLDGYSMEIIDTDVADEDAETYEGLIRRSGKKASAQSCKAEAEVYFHRSSYRRSLLYAYPLHILCNKECWCSQSYLRKGSDLNNAY